MGAVEKEIALDHPHNDSNGSCHSHGVLARQAAQALGIPLKVYRPDYARHGRAAPLMRNDLIVQRAHYVLAFWDGSSRGTAYTIRECIRRHVPVRVILLPKLPKSAEPGP